MRRFARRLVALFRRSRLDRELDDEIAAHLEMAAADHVAHGMTPEDARLAARRSFGGVAQAREACRDRRGWPVVDALAHDVRFSLRSLRKSPTSTVAVVATLALGIAANAVVFALLRTVVLKPLPYERPDRLVTIAETDRRATDAQTVDYATAQDWKRATNLFERLALWGDGGIRPILDGRADQLRGMRVSADFFETLGVPMYLGRSFHADEDTPGGRNVLILTYGTWRERFGGDPGVIGRTLPAIGGSVTVVGVLPPDFHPLHMSNAAELPRVFMPLGWSSDRQTCRDPSCRTLRAIGRLRPGVSVGQANAELAAATRALVARHLEYPRDTTAIVRPLRGAIVGRFARALWVLEASVALLLVLACANAATVLVAQAAARQPEFAVRIALGAGRGRLVRQLLTEALVLATIAGSLGTSMAWAATSAVAWASGANIPRIGELAPDPTILWFAVAVSAATLLLFGLAPAVLAARGASLPSGRITTGGPRHTRILDAMVAIELGAAFVLVLIVGLLARSYLALMRVDPGFDAEHLVTVSLLPDEVHYTTPITRIGYFESVVDRMRRVAGVEDAAYASTLPLARPGASAVYVREHPLARGADAPLFDAYLVSTNYLEVMRIPVRRGRGFSTRDTATSEPVALVSESAARREFAGEDPIGRHIQIDSRDDRRPWATIVGIVGDVHQYGLDRGPDAAVYVPFAQVVEPSQGWASLVVRSNLPVAHIESAVRAAMLAVDPLQPVFHLQPMTTYLSLSVSQRTLALALLAVVGALALVLAIGGVYAVVSYVVEQRRREVGLRIALGATPAAVRWMIVRRVLLVAAAATTAGFAVAAASSTLIAPLLFGVGRFDAETSVAAAMLLGAAVLGASYSPAARAGRVDPATALRGE